MIFRTPINTDKGKTTVIFGTRKPLSVGQLKQQHQLFPEHIPAGSQRIPGQGAVPAGEGALTAAEPVVGGELQGALGAVPALPPELELAFLHPAVCPGRHAAGERQVSLAWETAGLKSTLF